MILKLQHGYAIMLMGGDIAYHSKKYSVTALSSTESEFYAAVSAAEACLFPQHVLQYLGCSLAGQLRSMKTMNPASMLLM